MNTKKVSKLNQLLQSTPYGAVLLSSWLGDQGYSLDLQKQYRKSGWFESIGTGAMVRTGNELTYLGGLYALQKQSNLPVHIGGRSALALQGKAQYLESPTSKVSLFAESKVKLPGWFMKKDWGPKIAVYSTSFLKTQEGLKEIELSHFSIKISNPARAILECLYLAPKHQEIVECYEIMQSLNNLKPKTVQELLEKCTSIKATRLFLYLADKCNHNWFSQIDVKKVDLGSGKRSIVKNGIFNNKYKITVPRELEKNEEPEI